MPNLVSSPVTPPLSQLSNNGTQFASGPPAGNLAGQSRLIAATPPAPLIQETGTVPNVAFGLSTTIVSSSFTPPANVLIVAVTNTGNTAGTGTTLGTVTDSVGSTWTLLRRANGAGFGSSEVWAMDSGSSPASRTVTVTTTGGANATGVSLAIRCLSGAKPVAQQPGATAGFAGTTAQTVSITTTTADSLVVGGYVNIITSTGALVTNAITTAWQSSLDTTNTEKYGAWRATDATTTPGATVFGYTNAVANNQAMAAVEIIAATGSQASSGAATIETKTATAATCVKGGVAAQPTAQHTTTADAGTKTAIGVGRPTQHTADTTTAITARAAGATLTQRAVDAVGGQRVVAGATQAATRSNTRDTTLKQATSVALPSGRTTGTTTTIKQAAGATTPTQHSTDVATGAAVSAVGGGTTAAGRTNTRATGVKGTTGVGTDPTHTTTAGTTRKQASGIASTPTRALTQPTTRKQASGAATDTLRALIQVGSAVPPAGPGGTATPTTHTTTTTTGRKTGVSTPTAPTRPTTTPQGKPGRTGAARAHTYAHTRPGGVRATTAAARAYQHTTTRATTAPAFVPALITVDAGSTWSGTPGGNTAGSTPDTGRITAPTLDQPSTTATTLIG